MAPVLISGPAITALFKKGTTICFRVLEGIPDDATLIGAEWRVSSSVLALYFESEEFDSFFESEEAVFEHPIEIQHGGCHGNKEE